MPLHNECINKSAGWKRWRNIVRLQQLIWTHHVMHGHSSLSRVVQLRRGSLDIAHKILHENLRIKIYEVIVFFCCKDLVLDHSILGFRLISSRGRNSNIFLVFDLIMNSQSQNLVLTYLSKSQVGKYLRLTQLIGY